MTKIVDDKKTKDLKKRLTSFDDLVDMCNNDNNLIPREIDTHLQLYGKHAWEVEYKHKCLVCEKRVDEFGFCACGSGSE